MEYKIKFNSFLKADQLGFSGDGLLKIKENKFILYGIKRSSFLITLIYLAILPFSFTFAQMITFRLMGAPFLDLIPVSIYFFIMFLAVFIAPIFLLHILFNKKSEIEFNITDLKEIKIKNRLIKLKITINNKNKSSVFKTLNKEDAIAIKKYFN